MSQQVDLESLGRQYLQNEAYGAAAFCLFRAVQQQPGNGGAWNGLVLSLSLMRKEEDVQTVLARFGLMELLPFDKDMVTFAMMMWQHSHGALAEWIRAVSKRKGISTQDSKLLTQMVDDLDKAYQELIGQYGEETLKAQGMLSLSEYAARRIELDWLTEVSPDEIFAQANQWLENPETALAAVRMLCMLPNPRSEKLLRRVCRDENVDGKVRTHALLALRWLGVRGNARLHKFGESFIVDLDNPVPELTVSVPEIFKPALDRMKLWIAMRQGFVTPEEYERHAATDEAQMPGQLAAKVDEAHIPSVLQEVAHMLLRTAYDQYYPLVPRVTGTRQWSAALLILIKDYAEGIGEEWPFGEPESDEQAILHRNWLLSGSPDYYNSIKDVAEKRGMAQQQD